MSVGHTVYMTDKLEQLDLIPVSREHYVQMHLALNIFPPAPRGMVRVCVEAIDAMLSGDGTRLIKLPQGILCQGKKSVAAEEIVYHYRLESWCNLDTE